MRKKNIILFTLLIVFIYFLYSYKSILIFKKNTKKFNPSELIIEHISDSYEWKIFGEGNNAFYIPLPIIIWDNGLKIFLSSDFIKNNKIVEKNGKLYKLIKNNIYNINSINNRINYKKIILDFSFTKNVTMILFSAIIIFLIFTTMKFFYRNNYTNSWNLGKILEPLVIFIRDEVAIPNIGHKKYHKYLPFLLTLFFFILFNNLLGLLPGAPNITGNINVTFVLALITFLVININANKNYWKHIFWMPNVPVIVKFLLLPIELTGIFIRPITLCIRLFANITAGHIVILSFISLIFIFKNILSAVIFIPFAFFVSLLEILVSFLQAYIFTTLSSLFIGMAVNNN